LHDFVLVLTDVGQQDGLLLALELDGQRVPSVLELKSKEKKGLMKAFSESLNPSK
jgi:hypothetical protein